MESKKLSTRDGTVNTFRKRRGRLLAGMIADLASRQKRPVRILDMGGRRDYWENVGLSNIELIALVNIDPTELERTTQHADVFVDSIGDARQLDWIKDQSFDLYHSNSVIEHVGSWQDMMRMAKEARRVASAGWVQTPAWEFPIEPHFRLPFMHWFSTPARASLLALSAGYRGQDRNTRRIHAERINLLSKREMRELFPECDILVERVVLAKSYTARW